MASGPGAAPTTPLRTLKRMWIRGEVRWIFEADIVSFFDSLDRTELKKMLEVRVADGSLLRLIGKCLHVGVLDGEAVLEPELGTVQGSVLSPLLGNVYLHYVLDRWFETEVKPRLRGKATLIRYCDDFIIGFEREDDARRVLAVLEKRLGRFGLTLHPDKTRLLPFWRPPTTQQSGQGPATFDFLGFTFYWRRTRTGHWRMGCKTRRASLRRAKQAIDDWCRRHRHQPVEAQHAALSRRLRGHFNYFGVNGNFRSLLRLVEATKRAWYKWLCRRSQRKRLTLGEVHGSPPAEASSPPTDHGPDLGCVTTSHIDGRAGWWKSPCPDLARGRGGQPPGLLYNGTSRCLRERIPGASLPNAASTWGSQKVISMARCRSIARAARAWRRMWSDMDATPFLIDFPHDWIIRKHAKHAPPILFPSSSGRLGEESGYGFF